MSHAPGPELYVEVPFLFKSLMIIILPSSVLCGSREFLVYNECASAPTYTLSDGSFREIKHNAVP